MAEQRGFEGLYARCKALIFPGKRISASRRLRPWPREGLLSPLRKAGRSNSGAARDKRKGPDRAFFVEQTPIALAEAVRYFEKKEGSFDSASIRAHAHKFDKAVFEKISPPAYKRNTQP